VAEDDAGILSAETLADKGNELLDTSSIIEVVDEYTFETDAWTTSVEDIADVVLA
jgi:hypothetical protein